MSYPEVLAFVTARVGLVITKLKIELWVLAIQVSSVGLRQPIDDWCAVEPEGFVGTPVLSGGITKVAYVVQVLVSLDTPGSCDTCHSNNVFIECRL